MSEQITPYLNLGIAGVALFLMYNLATKALDKVQTALENNTKAMTEVKEVIQKCKANA